MKLKSGFSLIELLVVVAIIGILAAIGTVGYNNYTSDASAAVNKANDKQIMEAVLLEDSAPKINCESGLNCAAAVASSANISQHSEPRCDQGKLVIGEQIGTLGRLACQ